MTDEKILGKIKKLMALSESPVEAEAKSALAKAQELLKTHNLSIKDIHKEKVEERAHRLNRKTPVAWMHRLTVGVMRGFNCDVLEGKKLDEKNWKIVTEYSFIGNAVDLEVAEYVLEYLLGVIKKLSKKYLAGLDKSECVLYDMSEWTYMDTRRTSYNAGLTKTFLNKVNEFNAKEENSDIKYSGGLTGMEMVHIKKDAVDKYISDKYKNIKEKTSGSEGRKFKESFKQGKQDGKAINIRKGVSDKEQNLLT